MTVSELANQIKSGSVDYNSVTINVVYSPEDGVNYIENTRSAVALIKAGIPVDKWNIVYVNPNLIRDKEGNKTFKQIIEDRLFKNNLKYSKGTKVIRDKDGDTYSLD